MTSAFWRNAAACDGCVFNNFEKQQFAYSAKHLNPQLETPIRAFEPLGGECSRCGGALQLAVGWRGRFWFPSCDAKRVAQIEAEFAELVAAA